MHVRQADGEYELVWWKWNVYETQEMYNLTVDEAHTYFVGDGQWLVHNTCYPYRNRTSYVLPGQQANHLNQNAAFGSIIPQNEGVSISLYGNALTDVGSQHYKFHASLENFWNDFRQGGSLFGQRPTNMDYSQALEQALYKTGLSNDEIVEAIFEARKNREAYGLTDYALIPRIPGKLNQRKNWLFWK